MLELGYVNTERVQDKVAMPGLINLVPRMTNGRVDMSRRNISIR